MKIWKDLTGSEIYTFDTHEKNIIFKSTRPPVNQPLFEYASHQNVGWPEKMLGVISNYYISSEGHRFSHLRQ